MKSRLQNLSDLELQDVLDATILSYKTYLEENFEIKDSVLSDKLFNVKLLNELYEKINTQEYIEAYEVYEVLLNIGVSEELLEAEKKIASEKMLELLNKLTVDFKSTSESLIEDYKDNKKTLYDVRFDKDIAIIDNHAKNDVDLQIKGFIYKFLKNKIKFRKLELFKDSTEYYLCMAKLEGFINAPPGVSIKIKDEDVNININEALMVNKVKNLIHAKVVNSDLENYSLYELGFEDSGIMKTQDNISLTYTYRDGIFNIGEDGKEKDASFLIGKKEINGEAVTYICIRGTEGKAKNLLKYMTDDYMNMDRHYSKIRPFLNIIVDSLNKNKKTDKLKIKISGHSLGGAMVEKFLEEFPNTSNIDIKAVTLASPGSLNKSQWIVSFLDEYFKGLGITSINIFVGGISAVARIVRNEFDLIAENKHLSFLKLPGVILDKIFPSKMADDRLTSVIHKNDLIPKFGTLAYSVQQEQIILSNKNTNEGAMTNHKVYNYYNEVVDVVLSRESMYAQNKKLFALDYVINKIKKDENNNPIRVADLSINVVTKRIEKLSQRLSKTANDYVSFSGLTSKVWTNKIRD